MTHEPGRGRHMMTLCEHCGLAAHQLFHNEHQDEYWCESCLDNANEAAWERHNERLMEDPPESSHEEQIRTWEEKQKLHRR